MASEPIGVVVGLRAEARIARGLGWAIAVGGGSAEGAEAAARSLAERGCRALISFGLAGGLDPALHAGALLLPRAFLLGGVRVPADPDLTGRLGGATCELLLCGSAVVATASDKARLFRETGAAGLDLESGAVVRVARERSLAVAALRAVCDPAGRSLPPAALVALSGAGAIMAGHVLGSVLRRPSQIPSLLSLAREAAAARRALMGRVSQNNPPPTPSHKRRGLSSPSPLVGEGRGEG